jgi:hypothetical protein
MTQLASIPPPTLVILAFIKSRFPVNSQLFPLTTRSYTKKWTPDSCRLRALQLLSMIASLVRALLSLIAGELGNEHGAACRPKSVR